MGYVSLEPYTLFECFLAWPSLHPVAGTVLIIFIDIDLATWADITLLKDTACQLNQSAMTCPCEQK